MDDLSFGRFQELIGLLSKVKQEEAKERLIGSAFTAFQLGAGGDKNFGQYLEGIGLANGNKPAEVNVTKEEAIRKAEHIKELLKKG